MGLLDPTPETLILIFLVIVFLLGGKNLPKLARALGKVQSEFRRGRDEIRRQLRESLDAADQTESNLRAPAGAIPASEMADSKESRARKKRVKRGPGPVKTRTAGRPGLEAEARRRGIDPDGMTDDDLRAAVLDRVLADDAARVANAPHPPGP